MNLNDVMRLTAIDVNKMTQQQLRAAVSIAASAANKRLARLGSNKVMQMSPAYQKAMERSYTTSEGGKFGVKGKNRNQLMAELKATKDFLGKKTSSVTGFKKVRSERAERMGGEFKDLEGEKDYWRTYRQIEEMHPELTGHHGSDEVQQDLYKMMSSGAGLQEYLDQINNVNTPEGKEAPPTGTWYNEKGVLQHYDGTTDDYVAIMDELLRLDYEKKQAQINDKFKTIEERNNG